MLDRVGVGPLVVNRGHPLNRGRVAWWLALPGTNYGGARWYDLAGSNHGTLTNGPAWRGTSRPGGWGHLLFDGVNDRVDVADAAPLDLTGPLAVAFWMNLTGVTAEQVVVSKGTSAGYFIEVISSKVGFAAGSLEMFSAATLAPNRWTHVVCTYNLATMIVYLDGASSNSTANATAPAANTDLLRIGAYSNNGLCVAGAVDDVAIWSRALSAAEVALDYRLSRQGYPGLLVRAGWPAAAAAAGATFVAREPLVVGQAVTRAASW